MLKEPNCAVFQSVILECVLKCTLTIYSAVMLGKRGIIHERGRRSVRYQQGNTLGFKESGIVRVYPVFLVKVKQQTGKTAESIFGAESGKRGVLHT